ncbi:hypothetical protein ACFE04_017105 [Oxalis oulophora]
MVTKVLIFFLVLLATSHSLSSDNFLRAADILSYSGYLSMSLTLRLLYQNITMSAESQSLTVFAPSDYAFSVFGQPNLSTIRLYFSPLSISLQFLHSLPRNSKLPTLSDNQYLIITSSPQDEFTTINRVRIEGSPLYDDGVLVVFGTEEFFDPSFSVARPLACVLPSGINDISFSVEDASGFLKSRGYAITASFLDLQVKGHLNRNNLLTVFAVGDNVVKDFVGNFIDYSSLFFRHVLPCKMAWRDLVSFDEGTILGTFFEGFRINVTKFGDIVMVNGVPVVFPDMYSSELMVIHGLNQVLVSPEIGMPEF